MLLYYFRPLYLEDDTFTFDLDNTVYALNSSTIDLCSSTLYWAKFRKNKGVDKMHISLDLRENTPVFRHITDGKTHDVNIIRRYPF